MDINETPKKREFESVLPMINIVFLLLIFFMLAGTFTQPEILSITPPNAHTRNTANQDHIVLSVDANKQFAIDATQYSEADVLKHVSQIVRKNASSSLQLKADANLTSQHLIDVMETLSTTGLETIHLLVINTQ
jgi:biopolymer transport protein ExbD